MAEIGTENTYVIASTITHAHNCFWRELVGDTKTRSESTEGVVNIAIRTDVAKAGNTDGTGSIQVVDVGEASVPFTVNGLGEVNLPAQAIVDGEL